MRNSTHVISAWDGDRMIGLVSALDVGAATAFLHYVLVDPKYQGARADTSGRTHEAHHEELHRPSPCQGHPVRSEDHHVL